MIGLINTFIKVKRKNKNKKKEKEVVEEVEIQEVEEKLIPQVPSRKKYYIGGGLIILLLIGYFSFFRGEEEISYETVVVQKQDLIQEVSVTGNLRSFESVDLGFETSGRLTFVGVDIGDKVAAGDDLMKIDNSEIVADLAAAKADVSSSAANVNNSKIGVDIAKLEVTSEKLGLETEKAQLDQQQSIIDTQKARLSSLETPPLKEEVQIKETLVENAKSTLVDAETNLENVIQKADADLLDKYALVLSDMNEAFDASLSALITVSDLQFDHNFVSQDKTKIERAKRDAINALFDEKDGGGFSSQTISGLSGGLKDRLENVDEETDFEELDLLMEDVKTALREVKQTLDITPVLNSFSSAEKTDFEAQKTNINNQIAIISDNQNNIELQKVVNKNNITAAETELNETENAVLAAENELILSEVGTTPEDIDVQESLILEAEASYKIQLTNLTKEENDIAFPVARIDQARAGLSADQARLSRSQADVQQIQVRLNKTVLSAPMTGIIAKKEGDVGELVSSNNTVISIISDGHFKIEAFIPEVDIAKIEVGDQATFTLDALGPNEVFSAKVIKSDPAETIIEGVTTYKITFEFLTADSRIRSNMTTNLDILTDQKENVIAVLQRAIIEKDGLKFVRVLENGEVKEVEVETGLSGNGGLVEITSGLNEGDEVITFINE